LCFLVLCKNLPEYTLTDHCIEPSNWYSSEALAL
jgi:hypothetical protein